MVSFPPAKINLGLNIIGKRPDGYHDLVTAFYPIPWLDVLEIIPSDKFSFAVSGLSIPGNPQDNLCIRAYRLLATNFDLPAASIHLHKIIPTGAGLGGGSSDAAFTLRLLNRVFDLALTADQLKDYASQLGSDCSFFVQDEPRLGSGRGEILSPLSVSLKGKFLIVVKPDIHISTAEAYAGVNPKVPRYDLREIIENRAIEEWKDLLKNDFEESVFKKYPTIAGLKNTLYNEGALYSSMSGSGAAVFGIFADNRDLKNKFEGTATWSGTLLA